MIIDSHLHLVFTRAQHWEPLVQRALHHMQMAGVVKTCLMPHPQFAGNIFPNQADMTFQAETLVEVANAYPDIFLPLLFINPSLPSEFTLELMEKHILNGPIIGAKFHISMIADDERYEPIYNFLEKHDIPLLFHSWYKTVQRTTFESTPADIAIMARKHPKLRILMAHLTGAKLRGIQDIKALPNVYLDTSGSQPEEGYLERAIEELGAGRVLYGSDYPIRAFSTQIARIDSVTMSQEDREKVMYRNALKFFRKGGA
jgi:uncharacterized protein